MIRCTLTTILFSSLLISCGDEKHDEPVVNNLLGTWKAPCIIDDSDPKNIEYSAITLEVKEEIINSQFSLYSTSSCEKALTSTTTELTYILGEQATTLAGDEVRNIDITVSSGDVVLDIFKIEQGYLYFGEDRDDALRPDTVDFTVWFEKQY